MIKNDEEIRQDWKEHVDDNIEQALLCLKKSEHGVYEYLAECVASVCETTVKDMLDDNNYIWNAHARWLFWYAYRYMTQDSYEKMARALEVMGHPFAYRTIQSGVTKMTMLIDTNPAWNKRWMVIKRIIKLSERNDVNAAVDNTIVIQVPRHLKDKVNITIKEK